MLIGYYSCKNSDSGPETFGFVGDQYTSCSTPLNNWPDNNITLYQGGSDHNDYHESNIYESKMSNKTHQLIENDYNSSRYMQLNKFSRMCKNLESKVSCRFCRFFKHNTSYKVYA